MKDQNIKIQLEQIALVIERPRSPEARAQLRMNCPYCGAIDCPGALGCECRTVRPFLSEREFIARLTEAGWTQAQAEQEYQSIQEEHESGE